MSTTIKNGQPSGGDPVVTSTTKKKNKRSTFKLDYSFANTPMFGFCTPFWNEWGVPGDKWKVRSGHELRSLNLSAPLMQNLVRHKFYTSTPMRAILPRTWHHIYTNPINGDDIDSEKALPLLDFRSVVNACMNFLSSIRKDSYYVDPALNAGDVLTRLLIAYSILSGIYGPSALCKNLGIIDIASDGKLSDSNGDDSLGSITQLHDRLFTIIQNLLLLLRDQPEGSVRTYYSGGKVASEVINLTRLAPRSGLLYIDQVQGVYDFIHWWQRNPCVILVGQGTQLRIEQLASYNGDAWKELGRLSLSYYGADTYPSPRELDISPLIAYQMSMAEFMTDSKIDALYSAEQYRNQFDSISRYLADYYKSAGISSLKYVLNGVEYNYDAFSASSLAFFVYNFSNVLSTPLIPSFLTGNDARVNALFAFMDIFTLKSSIRYKDYFTGARKQPLAVGDVTASVSDDSGVSAIDVTKSIVMQRFLNAVNRIGPRDKNYLKGIYGETPMARNDLPSYLCDVSETIGTQETENTGADQLMAPQTTTSNFRSKGGNWMFEFDVKEECILLGISYFSIRQFYPRYMSWQSLNRKSRDDFFNPFFQHIGDQPISQFELGFTRFYGANDPTPNGEMPVFAYTTRDMQYKTRVDVCGGAFAPNQSLSPWIFGFRPETWFLKDATLNSDFIRYSPEELCGYYNAVPRSMYLAESFDFIIIDHNYVTCSRNMCYNPQIL